MVFNMSRNVWEKNQVAYSVVGRIFVNVVDDFGFFKISANMFFHDKAMFTDIPLLVFKWMIRLLNKDITLDCNFTTLPIVMFFKRKEWKSFIPCFLS